MRIDWYTKGVLTVIAVLLGVIELKQYVSPDTVAHAQGAYAGLQFGAAGHDQQFFDPRTGEIWYYSGSTLYNHLRLTKLGQPLVVEK
jgi:hypothetical protein